MAENQISKVALVLEMDLQLRSSKQCLQLLNSFIVTLSATGAGLGEGVGWGGVGRKISLMWSSSLF